MSIRFLDDIEKVTEVKVPSMQFPSFQWELARQRRTNKNIMFKIWGGIGDAICAEPVIRYAMANFKKCESFSIATSYPYLYKHLGVKDIFNLDREQPFWEKYLTFQNIKSMNDISFDFLSSMNTHCVDHASLSCFRAQIPIKDRVAKLEPSEADRNRISEILEQTELLSVPRVVIHPGKHWPTKTFPKDWWDQVLAGLISSGIKPILIGNNMGSDNQGTVDVNAEGCLDLRDHTSVMESVALLQAAHVLVTNDSSPLHMAATGNAHIVFIATAKHPELITHYRGPNAEFGWRMHSLGKGGYWDLIDLCPNQGMVSAEFIEPQTLRSWLPDPAEVIETVRSKIHE